MMLPLLALGFLGLPSASRLAAAEPAAATTGCPAANAGFEVLKLTPSNGSSPINVGVWYPTNAPESSYLYTNIISGSVALNGAISTCGKYPLVVFSHAYGTCGTQSVFLTEQLARNGYIVAAPDHADATCSVAVQGGSQTCCAQSNPPFSNPQAWNNQTYINRYYDNEGTINGMLTQAMFGPQIDATKIAMSGHSTGGYDTFAMIGGWSNWYDSRLQVGLMLSPYIQPFLDQTPSTVPVPKVPQMYLGGTLDTGITPYIMAPGGQYDQAQTPKIFLELQGASHFDFANLVCGTNPTTVQTCLATVPNAAAIYNYSAAFLNFYLNYNQGAASLLWGTGSGLAAYWRNTVASPVSSASYSPAAPLTANEITALFGAGMAYTTTSASSLPLPLILNGTVVQVTDSQGATRPAQLLVVTPGQINFLIPQATASGTATITVTTNGSVLASGKFTIAASAPSIYTVNASGTGLANAFIQTPSGFSFSYTPGSLAPAPIDVSSGAAYITFAGTGSGVGAASMTIGSTSVPVQIFPYAGFAGLDQIIAGPVPTSLNGSGTQTVSFSVGGVAANPVSIMIR
jgi:uncharacterized protein (TIGR03437 family)